MTTMQKKYGLYGLLAAVAFGVALWAGVPGQTLLLIGFALAMVLMHAGHGGHGGHGSGGHGSGGYGAGGHDHGQRRSGPAGPVDEPHDHTRER